jgi:hypothetical protein
MLGERKTELHVRGRMIAVIDLNGRLLLNHLSIEAKATAAAAQSGGRAFVAPISRRDGCNTLFVDLDSGPMHLAYQP